LAELGCHRVVAAATGRPQNEPGDMLRLFIWGYLTKSDHRGVLSAPALGILKHCCFAPAGAGLPDHRRVPT
jgi:hypothetical protein